jgi:predicted GH43/DUF377 family glycosyl hydrolase
VKWERGACLNAAILEENGRIYMFYRAIDHEPGWKPGGQSGGCYNTSVGLAVSQDGLHFERREEPLIPLGFFGPHTEAQDCRIVKIDGTYYLTYCLYNKKEGIPRAGYSTSRNLVDWEHHGEIVPFERFGFNKNAALFPEKINGRFALLHRPESAAFLREPIARFNWRTWSRGPLTPSTAPGVTISYSEDLRSWHDTKVVLAPRAGMWDEAKVGAGAPPIRTPVGWLNVYHGVDHKHVYRLGLALHDLDDPTIVLKRQEACLLQPELEWELKGDVDGAIFTCGAILSGEVLRVYYAGADTVIGVAEADVGGFLNLD